MDIRLTIQSRRIFSRPRAAALALAVSLVGLGASAAQAQLFNWDSALPRAQVERMIQASGYRLTGPIIRRGAVYLANVLGPRDDLERLIVDAGDGRVLQRFPAVRRADLYGGWPGQPPRPASMFGWLGGSGEDDAAAPRPPSDLDGETEGEPFRIAPARPPVVKQVARTDDAAVPHVILAPIGTPAATPRAPLLEKPRPRPEVKRKKFDGTPVAQPATTPGEGKPTPVAQPATAPAVATPVAAATAPHVAEGKAAFAPTTAAPVASPPKASAARPAVNDVPVAPLE
jgi:hypothetical protein